MDAEPAAAVLSELDYAVVEDIVCSFLLLYLSFERAVAEGTRENNEMVSCYNCLFCKSLFTCILLSRGKRGGGNEQSTTLIIRESGC